MMVKEKQFTIFGNTTIRRIALRKYDLLFTMPPLEDDDGNKEPLETYKQRVSKKCEHIVKYMKSEGLIDNGDYHFNVIVN